MKTTIGNYRCGKSIGQDILEKKIATRELYEYFKSSGSILPGMRGLSEVWRKSSTMSDQLINKCRKAFSPDKIV
jgi:hypothetical protein